MNGRRAGIGLILIMIASFFFWLETVLPTPDPSNDYSFIGFPLGFAGIVVCLISTKKNAPPARVELDHPRYREPAPLVLVVCPYCGAKNEQGILKCRKCSAEI